MKNNKNLNVLWLSENNNYWSKINNLNFLKKTWFNIPKWFILEKKIDKEKINILYGSQINSKYYIVRSSSNVEDSNKLSYAGLFISIFWMYKNWKIFNDINRVFDSINDKKIEIYDKKILWRVNKKKMNVLVQEYILWDLSGVFFNNINGDKLLSIVKWWNSLLVDSVVSWTNIYMWEKFNILKSEYNIQEKIINDNLNIIDLYEKVYIDKKILLLLLKEFIKIQRLYNYSIDIEWTIKDGIIYILQVRPITRNIN